MAKSIPTIPSPYKPALASPFPASGSLAEGDWAVEEKFDGHRMVVKVDSERGITQAWTRNGHLRELSSSLRGDLYQLPSGVYDGELVSPKGGSSFAVSNLDYASTLQLQVFDLLELEGASQTGWTLLHRRSLLEKIFNDEQRGLRFVHLTKQEVVPHSTPFEELVEKHARPIWDRGGEGLIVKDLCSIYLPGKRMKTWVKIKKLESVVMQLIGFEEGLLGPFSRPVFAHCDGDLDQPPCVTKWKDFDWLKDVEQNGQRYIEEGRRARIEYQQMTEEGYLRHPRFDRWEDE